MHASDSPDSTENSVVSPFSDADSQDFPKRKRPFARFWLPVGLAVLLILGIGGFFLSRFLTDPLRTLEPFPVSKYLESYKALAGSKFRGELRVENDLGWKDGIGRLMVFTINETPQPVVVLIPPVLAQIYFTKGQSYSGELEVKEGGLVYANSILKN